MRLDRFTLGVVLLAVVVAGGSFAIGLRVLDDGRPDAPPRLDSSASDEPAASPLTSSTTSTAGPSTTGVSSGFPTPAWIVIVASEKDRAPADDAAAEAAATGHPAGVLRSDDYTSLSKGLWVGYAGPYATSAAAKAAEDELKASGINGAYTRCAGTKQECKGVIG